MQPVSDGPAEGTPEWTVAPWFRPPCTCRGEGPSRGRFRRARPLGRPFPEGRVSARRGSGPPGALLERGCAATSAPRTPARRPKILQAQVSGPRRVPAPRGMAWAARAEPFRAEHPEPARADARDAQQFVPPPRSRRNHPRFCVRHPVRPVAIEAADYFPVRATILKPVISKPRTCCLSVLASRGRPSRRFSWRRVRARPSRESVEAPLRRPPPRVRPAGRSSAGAGEEPSAEP